MTDEVKDRTVTVSEPSGDGTLPIIVAEKPPDPLALYGGASSLPFEKGLADKLATDFDPELVEIKPHNGVVYLPGTFYRQRLNQTFGPGGWAMIPRGPRQMRDGKMFREYALYCHGRFVAEAVGDQEWIERNPDMSEADAADGCKTNAIQRCCKDLGIGSKLWEPGFLAAWKKKYAVQVWVKGKEKPQWRRKDRDPLRGESGEAEAPKGAPASAPSPVPQAAPVQSAPRPPEQAPPAPVAYRGGPVISEAQGRRFYAIWNKAGKTKEKVAAYLGSLGLKTDREMPRSVYEQACLWAETVEVEGEPIEDGNEDYNGI